jgi:dimethylargininase
MSVAITRGVPASFARALAAVPVAIDVERATAQHAAYREALVAIGLDAVTVPSADELPDSCFVEDTAIVIGGLAIITRPGAPSRRAEVDAVADCLAARIDIARIAAPATIDGGDCMRVGTTLYIGRSARTTDAAIAQVDALLAPRGVRVVAVDLPPGVLHLKCVCAPLGDDRITLADATIARDAFAGVDIVAVPAGESYAANVLAYRGRVLVADGFPRTRDALVAAGLTTVAVPTTEFRKADGALTCLSIVLG